MLSPDGLYLWNGREWVPNVAPAPPRFRKEPTPWTRPLQLAVIGLTLVGDLNLAALLPFLIDYVRRSVQQSVDVAISSQPGTAENADQVREQVRQFSDQAVVFMVLVMAVFATAWLILILIGTWKRWTWLFWVLMVVSGLAVLGLPQEVLQLFRIGTPTSPNQPVFLLPLPNAIFGTLLALAQLGLFVWMVVAYRRYGPWACRKVPA
jgi:hypothetical protein